MYTCSYPTMFFFAFYGGDTPLPLPPVSILIHHKELVHLFQCTPHLQSWIHPMACIMMAYTGYVPWYNY